MKHSKEHYVNQTENLTPIERPVPIKRTPELMVKLKKIGCRALRQPTDQLKVLLYMESGNPLKSADQVYAFLDANKSTYGVPNRFDEETSEISLKGTESQLLQLIDDAFADKPPLNSVHHLEGIGPINLHSQST